MSVRLLQRLLPSFALLAACALGAPASAQLLSEPAAGISGGTPAGSSTVTTPHVRAELVAHAPDGVGPGKPLWLGLSITHQPEWHTYWKNPGDSGLPTQIEWRQLPPGIDAGEIAWPVPRKIPIGTLANYGYEGTVLLPVPMTVSGAFSPGPLARNATFTLHASWLVCRKECIPEEGTFTLQVPIASTTAMQAQDFEAARQAHPQPLSLPAAAAAGGTRSHARVDRGMLVLTVAGLPEAVRGKPMDFFPETPGIIETADDGTQDWQGDVWTARMPLSAQRSEGPMSLPVVLAQGGRGWRAELPVEGGWPRPASLATVSPALEAALRANAQQAAQALPAAATPAPAGALAAALLGALLGGLVLNLMPCVFPVLAIKVAGFARHGQDRRAHRLGGIAYTAGVVLSFLALGGAMLALRAAGEAVGWGFQLQSPAVVAVLAALFTLIGLNLSGMFEFGRMLPSSLAGLQARHPAADAFLTGVLAVAVASPCTAPFMGASVGLTATLPAAQALAVFAALGVGLARPYLAASWVPAVARALPRPGAWMDTLRRFLAFPMFATVVWLVWVLGQQSGIDGAAALLALLVALGMVVWAFTLAGRARMAMAPLSLVVFAALAMAAVPKITEMAPPAMAFAAPGTSGAAGTAPNAAAWQAWRPGLAEELLAQGRPVFVDYTAAWCVTCQFNKKTTLSSDAVLREFAGRNVALLRADWTRRDPAITAALAQLGRSGVPVYVLQAPGRRPVVFSEILGERELRTALAAL